MVFGLDSLRTAISTLISEYGPLKAADWELYRTSLYHAKYYLYTWSALVLLSPLTYTPLYMEAEDRANGG